MNSRQSNFFIVPEDLDNIYTFFNAIGIKYINISESDKDHIILNSFPYKGKMTDKIYLSCDGFHSKIAMEFSAAMNSYFPDSFKSYLLEFDRGGFHPLKPSILERGRFYCITSYFVSNGESVRKNDDFRLWVDKIFRKFKKEFLAKLGDEQSILFSSKTLKWMEKSGGRVDKAYLTITA